MSHSSHQHSNQAPVSFEQLNVLSSYSTEFSRLDNDCLFAHLSPERGLPPVGRPLRIDGWLVALCLSGTLEMEIDLRTCSMRPGSVACLGLDNIVRLDGDRAHDLDAYLLVLSPKFLRDLNIDLNVINISAMAKAKSVGPAPFTLPESDAAKLGSLLKLVHDHASDPRHSMQYRKNIVKSLLSALLYHLMSIGDSMEIVEETFATPTARRSIYVQQFMRLVQQFHRSERTISFYAEKLFISPKYLSLIIKESTGRSASQWIDDMVILEAKNLLRFSGKNIQQVAYELHFCNQSAFGKYFKHITGMSPTQYQKS